MILGLAADDIIEADPDSLDGYRLVKRGQNVAVHIFCEEGERDAIEAALNQTIGQIGGELDGKMGATGLCYTIPVMAGFGVIEGALSRLEREDWTYSNVHDLGTGELLNWWLAGAE